MNSELNEFLTSGEPRFPWLPHGRSAPFVIAAVVIVLLCILGMFESRAPAHASGAVHKNFEVTPGEGFAGIADRLEASGIVRSSAIFKVLALGTGSASRLKAGYYEFSTDQSAREVLRTLSEGAVREVDVRIPEGATTYEIDKLLGDAHVIRVGELVTYVASASMPIEGRLFPDSYRFFALSGAENAVKKMTENFDAKAGMLLSSSSEKVYHDTLVLASLIEKEVPDFKDRQIVSGILVKRIKAGMPLQVDATVCYAKEARAGTASDCLPLAPLDFKIDSPYNTYLHSGWPPGPIGNPGLTAIQAALRPLPSPYWFYLSDLKTKKTVFSATLGEHAENRAKHSP